jgi:hypothetical protein
MKSIILTIGLVLTSMVAMSQNVKTVSPDEIPLEQWYEVAGDDYEGVRYITSNDEWIKVYLKEMLEEDNISINKPDTTEKENGVVIYMTWRYKTLDGHNVFVSYLKNKSDSDIAFYYFD